MVFHRAFKGIISGPRFDKLRLNEYMSGAQVKARLQ